MTTIAPYSLFSSYLIIITALYLIKNEGYTKLNLSLLLLGITSSIHHSRLDEWWINDIWKYLDYIAILIFLVLGFDKFKYDLYWLLLILYSVLVLCLIIFNFINIQYVPILHSTIHICLCIFMLYKS